MLQEIILSILMTISPHKDDTENYTQQYNRKTIIAKSTETASLRLTCSGKWEVKTCKRKWPYEPWQLSMALLAQGKTETRFSERIHKGFCNEDECDPIFVIRDGKPVIFFRARNVWQVHSSPAMAQFWENSLGATLEATTNAAYIQGYYLSVRLCGGNAVKMFESQNGKGCKEGRLGRKKAADYYKFMSMYLKEKKKYERGEL